jgi:hypothetical protein
VFAKLLTEDHSFQLTGNKMETLIEALL